LRLRASDLVLRRGSRTVLAELSLEVSGGEVLLLTGPNGAGKTTLLRALAGLLPLAGGSIALEAGGARSELPEACHYVGHRNGLKAALTVAENAAFWGAYLDSDRSESRADAVWAALDRFGLAALADIPAGYLSAGQQRRLALTRLLMARRPVWLLDEPTVSLDAAAVASMTEIVTAHVRAGGIAIAATHVGLGLEGAREMRLGAAARDTIQRIAADAEGGA
jgi:heme exporter protein A